jgi:hypothetical protein
MTTTPEGYVTEYEVLIGTVDTSRQQFSANYRQPAEQLLWRSVLPFPFKDREAAVNLVRSLLACEEVKGYVIVEKVRKKP